MYLIHELATGMAAGTGAKLHVCSRAFMSTGAAAHVAPVESAPMFLSLVGVRGCNPGKFLKLQLLVGEF
jgi:hypothetical protein